MTEDEKLLQQLHDALNVLDEAENKMKLEGEPYKGFMARLGTAQGRAGYLIDAITEGYAESWQLKQIPNVLEFAEGCRSVFYAPDKQQLQVINELAIHNAAAAANSAEYIAAQVITDPDPAKIDIASDLIRRMATSIDQLESLLSDPSISSDDRKRIHGLIASLRRAIPMLEDAIVSAEAFSEPSGGMAP